jgi:hypothetical protein
LFQFPRQSTRPEAWRDRGGGRATIYAAIGLRHYPLLRTLLSVILGRQYHSDPCHHRCLTMPAESLCCRNGLDALLAGRPDRGPLQHPLPCITAGWEDRKIENISCHVGRIVFKPLIYSPLSLPSSTINPGSPSKKMATPPGLRTAWMNSPTDDRQYGRDDNHQLSS